MLRRRRAIEFCALVARGMALVGTPLYLLGRAFPAADVLPLRLMMTACGAAAVVMGVATVLSWLGYRHLAADRYARLSGCHVVLDTAVVVVVVCLLVGNGDEAAWAALVVPVVVAALRHRLPVALMVWMVTSSPALSPAPWPGRSAISRWSAGAASSGHPRPSHRSSQSCFARRTRGPA